MTKEEIALNIACDLLIGSVLYVYDYDRIFEEIMSKEDCVSADLIKEYILEHVEELGKEYFVKKKKPWPCDTCQTAIDRCGCQMDLCSEYQKWKEGDENG